MRLDIDTYKEILDTLTRNKMRSFLTGFGIFWGVFMLVFLIGGGGGTKDVDHNAFSYNQCLLNKLPNPMLDFARDANGK